MMMNRRYKVLLVFDVVLLFVWVYFSYRYTVQEPDVVAAWMGGFFVMLQPSQIPLDIYWGSER